MNSKRFTLKLIFIYIIYLYQYTNCNKDYIENKNYAKDNSSKRLPSVSSSFVFKNQDDYKMDGFESNITIKIGTVQTEILNSSNIYEFQLTDYSLNGNLLIINFYPLDCEIKITPLDTKKNINIKKVSNYEYDAFSVEVIKTDIPIKFKIQPIINPLDERNKKRDYHLVVNCFEKNNPILYLNDKEPTLIYFDSSLDSMTFSYKSGNLKKPVVFSFFIKENSIFEAEIMNGAMPNRTIGYKDNIIIDSHILNEYDYVNITVNKNKPVSKIATMIVRVSENNLSPFYLQKNLLNLGFMPINVNNHYYYMEVFNGEEGEIMIHNKINNAFLMTRTINKNETLNIKKFPDINEKKESNQYNDFSKKLYFSSSETSKCENGCYLLITYYSPDINLQEIDGIEYNLLARVWDENEFKSQIINIPLNEYVFGAIEISTINVHYYSIYIPEKEEIYVEIQGRNIKAFAKKGIVRINSFKEPYNSFLLTNNITDIEDEKLIIKLESTNLGLTDFENQYLSFAFSILIDEFKHLTNQYYFRVIQKKSNNDFIIYPLDTNKANLCQTSENNQTNSCFFIFKNDYKELNNSFSISFFGQGEVNYNAWLINDADYYTTDLKSLIERDKFVIKEYQFPFNQTFNFILFEIKTKFKEIVTVLFNFDAEMIPSPSLDIYSYQSFYLKNNFSIDYFLNSSNKNEYTLLVNNSYGEGYICFDENCLDDINKYYMSGEIPLSLIISNNTKKIHIFSTTNLFFYLKIKIIDPNNEIEELNYGSHYKEIKPNSRYSKAFVIKDIYNEGIDINFYFKFKNELNLLSQTVMILGYKLNYNTIKSIENHNQLENILDNHYNIQDFDYGKYDYFTKSGFISFDNMTSKSEFPQQNLYYLIVFYYDFPSNIYEFSVEIFITSKNNSHIPLQKNKYIRGSFNLLNTNRIENKVVYIQFEKNEKEKDKNKINGTYILEFSSNFKDIKLVFNDDFKYDKIEKNEVAQLYYFSAKNVNLSHIYKFTIQLDPKIIQNKSKTFLPNYIMKLYKKENDSDFIISKYIQPKKVNNSFYYFTIKNGKKNQILNNNYNYTYIIQIWDKNCLYENQLLNTTASIYFDSYYEYYYPIIFQTNDSTEEKEFNIDYLYPNKNYIVYLFIIINGKNRTEKYYSTYIEISTNSNQSKSGKKNIIIIFIIFGSIFIIALIIFIFIFRRMSKKNKNLKEQIQAISFSSGIDEDVVNKNKKTKDDDDYESTFI